MTFRVRINAAPEPITFHAHAGACRYCGDGIVKMRRDPATLQLLPRDCLCLQCGQPYFVVIAESLDAWEAEQWRQKVQER